MVIRTLEQEMNRYMRGIEQRWEQRERKLTMNETMVAMAQPGVMTILDDDYAAVVEVVEAEDVPKS